MLPRLVLRSLALLAAIMVAGCSHTGTQPRPASRAVVLVSGLASTAPYTSPDAACAIGLPAGTDHTPLREHLVRKGYSVFTAPAMAGPGQVRDTNGYGAFASCPSPLPAAVTVDSTGSIDLAGEHLARFIDWLHTEKKIDEVDLVGHSMGGLYSRAAIRTLRATGSPVLVRSLTTIGTPWQGSYLANYAEGSVALSACQGDPFCESQMKGYARDIAAVYLSGSARELAQPYLTGAKGWNTFQAGVLDDIPVTLIGGKRYTHPDPADAAVWPNDGVVELRSALARDVDDSVLPHRRCRIVDDTHSDYVSMITNLKRDTALTWDPRVLDAVTAAIDGAPKALDGPNRDGC
ncbi:esterase/lipase family protein [Mycolicibacterium sphagni]|uniref:esterase/lipase family protein n=1 Tax=Mycolicibacterium sphagni TaxID=1786 RepID=UPI0021F31EC0|nr:alpha/beta fold hydrolase [Mycolicibacterium sphagni]